MQKISRRSYLFLLLIIIIGITIRTLVMINVCKPDKLYPTMDEMNYRELACNILDRKAYETWSEGFFTRSTRAPVYPLMIAFSYAVSGSRSMYAPKILNAVFDVFTIILIFLIGRKLFGTKCGLVSSALYATFGHASYFMIISSPHTLGLMLLMLVILCLLYINNYYWFSMTLLTIVYAILIHTRPVFLVSLPFLLPAIYLQLVEKEDIKTKIDWISYAWKKRLLKSVLPIFLITLLFLPWCIRNYVIHKQVIPVCTIAGWHIASNIRFDLKLSLKYLTQQCYAPERKGMTEGEYFALSRNILLNSLINHPLKVPAFGLGRIFYCWSPPNPIKRFIQPRAYIQPIYISDNLFLPLPDFEGMIYLTTLAFIVATCLIKNKILQSFKYLFISGRGVWIIIIGYAFVHIIGIPLISYRFLLEPLFMIFAIAFVGHAYLLVKKNRNVPDKNSEIMNIETETSNSREWVVLAVASVAVISLVLMLITPVIYPGTPVKIDYPKVQIQGISYEQLRDIQWQNLGNIPDNNRVTLQGIAKYVHKGFRFVEHDYYAEKNPNFAAGRLFVRYGDSKTPAGIGDVRLNFTTTKIPKNGDVVSLSGTTSTGLFKEIIVNVDQIEIYENTNNHR